MQQIEINGQQYLCVEVPDGCNKFWVTGNFLQMYPYNDGDIKLRNLPAGNYEVAGLVKDLPIDTLYPLEVGYKNCNKYMGQPLNEPVFTPNTLILKIKENE